MYKQDKALKQWNLKNNKSVTKVFLALKVPIIYHTVSDKFFFWDDRVNQDSFVRKSYLEHQTRFVDFSDLPKSVQKILELRKVLSFIMRRLHGVQSMHLKPSTQLIVKISVEQIKNLVTRFLFFSIQPYHFKGQIIITWSFQSYQN